MALHDLIHGSISSAGRVEITFNAQAVRLTAPDKPGKPPQQWFPCEGCGRVDSVDLRLVSYHCADCVQAEAEEDAYQEFLDA